MTPEEALAAIENQIQIMARYDLEPWPGLGILKALAESLVATRADLATLRARVDALGSAAVTAGVQQALMCALAKKPPDTPTE